MRSLVFVLDIIGTFVFALAGATAGVRRQLDLFGVLVLSFVAATFGGIARDLLIGAVPPAALSEWPYMAAALLAGLITFRWYDGIERLGTPVRMFDAMGLSLFAVAGSQKALAFGLDPLFAAPIGMLTGIGGGMVRDVLLAEVPTVLKSDLYAVAALAGAVVVVMGNTLHLSDTVSAVTGAGLCFALRMMAVRYDWHLPRAWRPGSSAAAAQASGQLPPADADRTQPSAAADESLPPADAGESLPPAAASENKHSPKTPMRNKRTIDDQ